VSTSATETKIKYKFRIHHWPSVHSLQIRAIVYICNWNLLLQSKSHGSEPKLILSYISLTTLHSFSQKSFRINPGCLQVRFVVDEVAVERAFPAIFFGFPPDNHHSIISVYFSITAPSAVQQPSQGSTSSDPWTSSMRLHIWSSTWLVTDSVSCFLSLMGWDWQWVHLVLRPLLWLVVQAPDDDDDCGAIGGMQIGRGNRNTWRKPALVPFCSPQTPHEMTRAWIRAVAVGSRRLTAWAIARPQEGG
jgi:hypothetical protein